MRIRQKYLGKSAENCGNYGQCAENVRKCAEISGPPIRRSVATPRIRDRSVDPFPPANGSKNLGAKDAAVALHYYILNRSVPVVLRTGFVKKKFVRGPYSSRFQNQNKSDARRHRGRRTRRQSDARQRGKRPCRCSVQDAMTRQPECKWAQRPDRILFTVNVPNVEVEKADIRV